MKFDKKYYDDIWQGVHRHDYVDNWISNIKNDYKGIKSILDIGTGCGYMVKRLREEGYDAWGLEISDYALENSCAKGYVVKGDVRNIPFPDNRFDLVFSQGLWTYIPENEVDKTVKEVYRVGKLQRHNIDHDKCLFLPHFITWKPIEWWDQKLKPLTVDAYILCGNQEKMIRHILNYYLTFCRSVTVYDGQSEDKTVKIIEEEYPSVKVIPFDCGKKIRLDVMTNIKNTCWKASDADFVIVCDSDEFVWSENITQDLLDFRLRGITVIDLDEIEMVSDRFPDDYAKPITEQVRFGLPYDSSHKQLLFSPKDITDINYTIGAHQSSPAGNVKIEKGMYFLSMRYLGKEFSIEKYKGYAKRLSKVDREHGRALYYLEGKEHVEKVWERLNKFKTEIIPYSPKVLVACPTHIVKDYSFQKWIDVVTNLTYPNYELFVVDNSPGGEMVKKYGSQIPMVHLKVDSEDKMVRINNSMEVIRQKFLSGSYSYWFNLECDVIPTPDILDILMKFTPLADWIGHAYPIKERGDDLQVSSGIGCTLLSRDMVKDYSFERVDESPDAAIWAVAQQRHVKTAEIYHYSPIKHLNK